MKAYKRITVKVGSNVLTRSDGTLDVTHMSALVDQIAALKKKGLQVVLVSSGAVASGRSELHITAKLGKVEERQLFSAVGQAKLINRYYELFREYGIPVGQVLTMKENFSTRSEYLNQRNCIEVMLENGVLPIVNENDTTSVTELMFTDNDELSGLVATMTDSDALFILSNVDGIFTGPPSEPASKLIKTVEPGRDLSEYIQAGTSGFGRGGMGTKSSIARKVAEEGIEVVIANGKTPSVLLHLMEDEAFPCTRFLPVRDAVSSVKKWIAHSSGFAKGAVYLNDKALKALTGQKAVSLLPVGVTKIEGEFEKDDIIRLLDAAGREVGVGRASYNSRKAGEVMGKHDERPLIHYDYLFLEV